MTARSATQPLACCRLPVQIGAYWGRSLICGLARLDGWPCGVFANDGRFTAGAMSAQAAQKVRRLIDLCQQFHIPGERAFPSCTRSAATEIHLCQARSRQEIEQGNARGTKQISAQS
eukprot:COSAG01_NODE_1968_length_8769_cov_5.768166_6_plen_117_part_00